MWNQIKNKNMYYPQGQPLSDFDDGDVLVLSKDGSGRQYLYEGGGLFLILSDANTLHKDYSQKLKGELFRKITSLVGNVFDKIKICRQRNKLNLTALHPHSISETEFNKLMKLNNSDDYDAVMLVTNILKQQYNVDIQ